MSLSEHATLLALVEAVDSIPGIGRHRVADLVETLGGAGQMLNGARTGFEPVDEELVSRILEAVRPQSIERWEHELAGLVHEHSDIALLTVDEVEFPVNLRQTYDRTPFLFVHGNLDPADERAIAVVGARRPSPEGLDQANRLATSLAEAHVTIVSGLAEGIDTTAHRAAVEAGGRTVAVLAHGILAPIYPRSNTGLADTIVESGGALVSQFWPSSPPTKQAFPIRNVTTSGLSLGTVVVEAGETSGARQQARKCLEHGKQLFLLNQLVATQDWARRYADRPGVVVVNDVDEILTRIEGLLPTHEPVQLVLG